jgi:hypothetical protein
MRTIHYSLHFRGRISSVIAGGKALRSTGSATSCTVTTTVRASGLEGALTPTQGDLAFLDSELRVTGNDSFQERGTIAFGDDSEHLIRFSTIDRGHLTPGYEPGLVAGIASCSISGGEGQFNEASGFITSTFTLTDSGELNNFHSGLIFLPDELAAHDLSAA